MSTRVKSEVGICVSKQLSTNILGLFLFYFDWIGPVTLSFGIIVQIDPLVTLTIRQLTIGNSLANFTVCKLTCFCSARQLLRTQLSWTKLLINFANLCQLKSGQTDKSLEHEIPSSLVVSILILIHIMLFIRSARHSS